MKTPIRSLRIESLWNGEPVPEDHWITVHLLDAGDAIELRIDAPFYGDPGPPDSAIGPTPMLWEHEVVEVFISGLDDRYTEIEMAPSGHHLVIQLRGVRNAVAELLPLDFEARVRANRWRGVARIERSLLPDSPWRINAAAIHGSGADRAYLSCAALPGNAPDFHQPDRFLRVN